MTDKFIRHFIAFVATAICLLIYFAGYISGTLHWWWTVFALIVVYWITYHLVEA